TLFSVGSSSFIFCVRSLKAKPRQKVATSTSAVRNVFLMMQVICLVSKAAVYKIRTGSTNYKSNSKWEKQIMRFTSFNDVKYCKQFQSTCKTKRFIFLLKQKGQPKPSF